MQELIPESLRGFSTLLSDRPPVQAAAILAAALLLAKLADWLTAGVLGVWARRTTTDLDDRLIALLRRPVFWSVVLIGVWQAGGALGLSEGVEGFLLRALKSVATVIWLVFLFRLISLALDILSHLERKVTIIEPRTVTLFENVSKLALFGGAVYALFLTWGIDVGGVLVGAGVAGIALGFAAKDTLANLFSGIFILADAPYQVGDFVVLDSGERGEVTQVGLRSTRLLTRDDVEVTVPNAVIANAKIINESGGPTRKERVRVQVGVAYGSDVDRVREALMKVAGECPDLAAEPAPRVRFRAFGESSLDFELLGWVDEPVLRGRVLDDLNTRVYKRFAADGIEIPFPQRDVHLRGA